jgi:predicted polyphosphate/ATP-dependent NAD kinase
VIVGFVINPVAGMGGRVGLKGTDGPAILKEARSRGARPIAEGRAIEALSSISRIDGIDFLTAGGPMGETALRFVGAKCRVVYQPSNETGPLDTKNACEAFTTGKAALIVFVGGDGTARDVMDAVDKRIPVLGVPSGVKMHSAAFANDPRAAGQIVNDFALGLLSTEEEEVMDVDEAAFRDGRISASLYGQVLVPYKTGLIQPVKGDSSGPTAEEEKDEVAQALQESMKQGVLYVLGPGTTVEAVTRRLGLVKTLLGVDAVLDGKVVAGDVTEPVLYRLVADAKEASIVVTPIGNQGFLFGRGNQQISPRIIRMLGKGKITVIGAPSKLASTPVLHVDTGDAELDNELRGYVRVITGYRRSRLMKIV